MDCPLVLLVEDSPDDAYFFQRQFRKSEVSASLVHFTDGLAAVTYLRRALAEGNRLPLVIFLDLKMPVMNGFEVLEWAQENRALMSTPIFVLSGSSLQVDRDNADRLGAAGYLVKPVTSHDLTRILPKAPRAEEIQR